MQNKNLSNYLVITAVGHDRPGLVNELTKHLHNGGCNIEDSRMTILGGEFAIILLLSGNWNAIAKIEDSLDRIGESLGLNIHAKQTQQRNPQPNLLSYHIEVLSIDHTGIIHRLADFFSSRKINIENLTTDAYHAAHTGTPMFSLHMTVNIPGDYSLAQLREQFLDFCDELNLDGIIEPVRT